MLEKSKVISSHLKIKKIIFIIADTVRAQNVGIYGKSPSPTPNIDKLATESLLFKNSYASITCTDPSITSIMSGKYPYSNGLVNHGRFVTPQEENNLLKIKLLPEILKAKGFRTLALDWLGRWHSRGYKYYSGKIIKDKPNYSISDTIPFPLFIRILDKISVKLFRREFFMRAYYALAKNPKIPYDPANVLIDKSLELLKKNEKEKLFLYIHFWDAHAPHTKPRGLKSYLFDGVEQTYNAEINFIDQQIGRLITYLKETKQLEETLVVLTSDHGENFYQHDNPFTHQNLKEDVVKVPLILRIPLLSPRKVSALVQHIDIFPTILELLKINIPKDIDGMSLLPLVLRKKTKTPRPLFFEDLVYRKVRLSPYTLRRMGIRLGNYKYIKTIKGLEDNLYNLTPKEDTELLRQELYNLKSDPVERVNLFKTNQRMALELDYKLTQARYKLALGRITDHKLRKKIKKSIEIIQQTVRRYKPDQIAVAFKGGKDTTTMMHIIKSLYGRIPFKVFFNDTTLEFKETYDFIKRMKKIWKLDLVIIRHDLHELKRYHLTKDLVRKKELSRLMKITAINRALKKYKFKGFMLGIRRDENPFRRNEKYFSKRPDHIRIHPMLDWTEKDIWKYINIFGVPYSPLYDQGYRSVGEKPYTFKSLAEDDERSGRDQEKEVLMGRLRKLGYW